MLKRQQVLLEDWISDYIKFLGEKYDLSFSEVLRLMICIETIDTNSRLFPRNKPDFEKSDLLKKLSRLTADKSEVEERHKLISKIYFEARKSMEFRLTREGKK